MTAGHFGFAAVVKSQAPRVPLWALMLSTYLLDVIFIVLVGLGLESFAPMDPANPAYGQVVIQAYYTHSLVGAALISLAAGLLAAWAWGRRAGLVIGAVVFSHWILDLLVHRPDLPLLPGNAGNLPLLGFGLWQLPAFTAVLELVLAVAGALLYYQSARNAAARGTAARNGGNLRSRALTAAGVTGLFLIMLLASDLLSLPIYIALLLMLLLIVLCGWLDSRLNWPRPAARTRAD